MDVRRGVIRALLAIVAATCLVTCAAPSSEPSDLPPPRELRLDRSAVIAALEYWHSAAEIEFTLAESRAEPLVFIRPGLDVPSPQGGGRGGIDGVYPDNRARSGIVVFEHGGGQFCLTPEWCRYLYRHEIGHALGFLAHSNDGLMRGTPDSLTERERTMIVALYSLPHGAEVQPDGRWLVAATGQAGILADIQVAQDIIDWNMKADGGSSARSPRTITRWELPVPVFIVDSCPAMLCAF